MPRDRPVRIPLPEWIADVERALDDAARADEEPEAVSECFRQAALIERHFGRLRVADALCVGHLRWLGEESARRGDPGLLGLALDPWIELARLDRLSGKEESSIRKLARLPAAKRSAAIAIGAVEIRADQWPAIQAARPGLLPSLDTTWIVETLKTMLAAKSFQRALDFAAREPRDASQDAAAFLAEAKIVALCHLGRREAAWDEAARRAGDVDLAFRPLYELRTAQALACFGGQPAALDLVRHLAEVARNMRIAERPNLNKLRFADQLVGLAWSLGARDVAVDLSEVGLAGATHLRDEPLRAAFLRRLAEVDGRFGQALDELLARTWYASLCATPSSGDAPRSSRRPPDLARVSVLDRLTRRLLVWGRE
jgi:hypothetical protein